MTNNENLPEPNVEVAAGGAFGWSSIRGVVGIAGRLSFVACACAVVVASLLGAPHVLYSYHVSHFAVLYALTLATLAGFPDWGVLKAFWRLMALVTALGLARVVMRHQVETNFLDWIADLSGIIGGLTPVAVQRLREAQLSVR
jgi:hypothetical protein